MMRLGVALWHWRKTLSIKIEIRIIFTIDFQRGMYTKTYVFVNKYIGMRLCFNHIFLSQKIRWKREVY